MFKCFTSILKFFIGVGYVLSQKAVSEELSPLWAGVL